MLRRRSALREAGRIGLPRGVGRARQGAEAAPRIAASTCPRSARTPCAMRRRAGTRRHRGRRRRHDHRRAAAPHRSRRLRRPVRGGTDPTARTALMETGRVRRHAAGFNIFIIAGEESGDRLGAPLMAAIAAQAGRPVMFAGVGGPPWPSRGSPASSPSRTSQSTALRRSRRGCRPFCAHLRTASRAVIAAKTRCAGHHRQSRFHPPGGAARARSGALDPDHRLRLADRMGVAAGAGGRDAPLCRPRAGAAAVRARGAPRGSADRHAPIVGHPCRAARDAAARSRRSGAAGGRPAARARAAGEPPRRDAAAHRRFGAAMAAVARDGSARSRSCCRRSRIFSTRSGGRNRGWPTPPRIVVDAAEKWAAFRQARAALAASGTVTLELALAGVPTVIAYRVALFEEAIARVLVTTRHGRSSQHHPRREGDAGAAAAGRDAATSSPSASRRAHRRHAGAPAPVRGLARLDAAWRSAPPTPSARAAAIVLAMAGGPVSSPDRAC